MMPLMVKDVDLDRIEVPEDYKVLDATALGRRLGFKRDTVLAYLSRRNFSAYPILTASLLWGRSGTRLALRNGKQGRIGQVASRGSTGGTEGSTESAESQDQAGDELPLEDYNSMNVRQIGERLDDLSTEEVRRLRDYEARNKNRRTLIGRLDRRIEAGSS